MDLLRWSGVTFCVRHDRVLGMKDITINATCETEDKDSGGEKFSKRKGGKPTEIALTALLNAKMGVNVQQEALAMQDAARNGTTDYMYTATAKLFPCLLMLTGAKISKVTLTPGGVWRSCEAALTFRQASKWDGGTSASRGKKKKKKKGSGNGNGDGKGGEYTLSWFGWDDERQAQKKANLATKSAQQQSAATLQSIRGKAANNRAILSVKNTSKGG